MLLHYTSIRLDKREKKKNRLEGRRKRTRQRREKKIGIRLRLEEIFFFFQTPDVASLHLNSA
jgi:hypothetical protein